MSFATDFSKLLVNSRLSVPSASIHSAATLNAMAVLLQPCKSRADPTSKIALETCHDGKKISYSRKSAVDSVQRKAMYAHRIMMGIASTH